MQKPHNRRAKKVYASPMGAVGPKLKALREATRPRISIRAIAELLDMSSSSYAMYENPDRYKKAYLPLPMARRIALIFSERGIDATEAMKLAGLDEAEAAPEARAIEAQRPSIVHLMMPVALPSEAALTDMFRALLSIVPEDASRDETAQILARRLPAGFAGIGPYLLDSSAAQAIGGVGHVPVPATDHPGDEQPSRRQ